MSGEQMHEASLISKSSGPVNISHSNINVIAGESSRDEKRKRSSTRATGSDRLQDYDSLPQILRGWKLDVKERGAQEDGEMDEKSKKKREMGKLTKAVIGIGKAFKNPLQTYRRKSATTRKDNYSVSSSSRENSKNFLQDSTQLSEKEEFQNILLFAELQLAEGDGDSAIARVEDFLFTESRSAVDAKNMAHDIEGQGHYVEAMILYKRSHDLHKKEGRFSPDDELYWISGRANDIRLVIRSLREAGSTSLEIVIKFAVKFLKQFLEDICEVKNANPGRRALVESCCLFCIASVHLFADEFVECIRFGVKGLKMMTQQFGENASNYKLYGWLSHNLGSAYHNSGRYLDADSCYDTAREIYTKASDYKTEKEREDDIALSKQGLERSRTAITAKPKVDQLCEEM